MGNIRQTYIKSTADALLRQYPNEFSKDFNENKDKVDRFAKVQTKNVRNHVARLRDEKNGVERQEEVLKIKAVGQIIGPHRFHN